MSLNIIVKIRSHFQWNWENKESSSAHSAKACVPLLLVVNRWSLSKTSSVTVLDGVPNQFTWLPISKDQLNKIEKTIESTAPTVPRRVCRCCRPTAEEGTHQNLRRHNPTLKTTLLKTGQGEKPAFLSVFDKGKQAFHTDKKHATS